MREPQVFDPEWMEAVIKNEDVKALSQWRGGTYNPYNLRLEKVSPSEQGRSLLLFFQTICLLRPERGYWSDLSP